MSGQLIKCVDCGINTEEELKLELNEHGTNYNCQQNYRVILNGNVYCACCIVQAKLMAWANSQ